MLSAFVILLLSSLIGLAFTPKRFTSSELTFGIGISILLFLTQIISLLSGLVVPKAISVVLILSVLIICYRLLFESEFLSKAVRFSWQYFTQALLLVYVFVTILNQYNIDIGTRNFDGYFAVQDGNFLNSHSISEVSRHQTELLPLNWSAGLHGRYGVSLLISFLKFLNLNTWVSSQYVYISLLVIVLLSIRFLAKVTFNFSSIYSSILLVAVIFSPAQLLQIRSFMFGQILGTIFVFTILSLIILKTKKSEIYLEILILVSLVCLFTAYVAMFFPMLLFYIAINLWRASKLDSILELLRQFVGKISIITFGLFTLYGFNLTNLINTFFIWISYNTKSSTAVQPLEQNVHFAIFGQYTSKLFIALSSGLLPYPYTSPVGQGQLLFLSLVGLIAISVAIYFSIQSVLDPVVKSAVLLFLATWGIFPIAGFFRGSSYVFFKFVIWLSPFFIIMLVATFRTLVDKISARENYRKSVALALVLSIFLFCNGSTSREYLSRFSSWTSFAQVPSPSEYSSLMNFGKQSSGNTAILSSTAEESTWIAGLMGSDNGTNLLSLGPANQVLGLALMLECNNSIAASNSSGLDSLLINGERVDIVPNPIFSRPPERATGKWNLYRFQDLEFLAIVKGAGLFPPDISTFANYDRRLGNATRWSSGFACFSFFSKHSYDAEIQIPYSVGPDFRTPNKWQISSNGTSIPFLIDSKNSMLKIRLKIEPGWQDLSIMQSACYGSRLNMTQLNKRADDRPLCFQVGTMKITKQSGI